MTRKQFFSRLAKYPGVTLDLQSDENGTLQIDTPQGKVFAANYSHTMVEPWTNFQGHSWKPEAYVALIERLSYGLIDCEETDCEVCAETEPLSRRRATH